MASIEYLFHECNLLNRVLEADLLSPIKLCGKFVEEIIILKVNCNEKEAEILTKHYFNGIKTENGVFSFSVSDCDGNPFNPQSIMVDINNIKNIWKNE